MFILCNCDLAAPPPPPLFGSAGALPSCFADDEILTSSEWSLQFILSQHFVHELQIYMK